MTSEPTSENGLTVRQATHFYGTFCALQGASLKVAPGQVHCLLGPSGSGKSTLLRLVAGLETLQQGSIHIGGVEVAGVGRSTPPERRSIGFVFQDYALFPHLDVLRNVLFGMDGGTSNRRTSNRGTSSQRRRDAHGLLQQVGMEDFANAMPHTLSGGQQQRVALARALARQPAIMLLDEPFSGLDTRLRHAVRQRTLTVLQAAGVATLMVTHDPGEALAASDLISVIRNGRIVQCGVPTEVYGRSADRHIAEVFGPVNCLPATVAAGCVATPFGPLPADGLADGQAADVLLRPESLVLTASAPGMIRNPGAPSVEGQANGSIRGLVHEGGVVHLDVLLDDGTALLVHDLARHAWRVGTAVHVTLAAGTAMVRATV